MYAWTSAGCEPSKALEIGGLAEESVYCIERTIRAFHPMEVEGDGDVQARTSRCHSRVVSTVASMPDAFFAGSLRTLPRAARLRWCCRGTHPRLAQHEVGDHLAVVCNGAPEAKARYPPLEETSLVAVAWIIACSRA